MGLRNLLHKETTKVVRRESWMYIVTMLKHGVIPNSIKHSQIGLTPVFRLVVRAPHDTQNNLFRGLKYKKTKRDNHPKTHRRIYYEIN
jgi:hypothetical protein